MSNVVEEQYKQWVYPLPIEDMAEAIQSGKYWEIGDPALYWPLFWPRKRALGKLEILVAGCGTNQAAYYACRHRDCKVVGVDLSESSLAHQEKLKKKHNLENLTLIKMDLTRIAELGQAFDFITSTGVLHHLPDPDKGLAALQSVLKPEGVMNIMVYGTSLRLGVYVMQDFFKTLGLRQTSEDLELVKAVIASLPPEHVVQRYVKVADDLGYDAGMVDTFLHQQDRSYYVNEVYDFAHKAQLEFLSWCDPIEYSLENHVPAAHPIWSKFKDLTPRQAAHACDLLTQNRGTHRFALAHPDYVQKNQIPFDEVGFLDCTVMTRPDLKVIEASDHAKQQNAKCQRRTYDFEVDYRLALLMQKMDNGKKTLREAIAGLGLSEQEQGNALRIAQTGFKQLWSQGHVFVLLPELP